jgi:arginine/ornithine transport system permease protein
MQAAGGSLRGALTQYSNEGVGLMHATAIASTVTLVEITHVARDVHCNHLGVTESFGVAAVFYFVLTFLVVGVFKLLEMRYLRHLNRNSAGPAVAR